MLVVKLDDGWNQPSPLLALQHVEFFHGGLPNLCQTCQLVQTGLAAANHTCDCSVGDKIYKNMASLGCLRDKVISVGRRDRLQSLKATQTQGTSWPGHTGSLMACAMFAPFERF